MGLAVGRAQLVADGEQSLPPTPHHPRGLQPQEVGLSNGDRGPAGRGGSPLCVWGQAAEPGFSWRPVWGWPPHPRDALSWPVSPGRILWDLRAEGAQGPDDLPGPHQPCLHTSTQPVAETIFGPTVHSQWGRWGLERKKILLFFHVAQTARAHADVPRVCRGHISGAPSGKCPRRLPRADNEQGMEKPMVTGWEETVNWRGSQAHKDLLTSVRVT